MINSSLLGWEFISVLLGTLLTGLRVEFKYLNQCHYTSCLIKLITWHRDKRTQHFNVLGASQAQMAFIEEEWQWLTPDWFSPDDDVNCVTRGVTSWPAPGSKLSMRGSYQSLTQILLQHNKLHVLKSLAWSSTVMISFPPDCVTGTVVFHQDSV